MFGQRKVNISAGIGFPDLVNISIKYRVFNQAKIGLNIGFWPAGNKNILTHEGNLLSFAGDFYYYFIGSSKISDMRPWYGRSYIRTGFNYTWDLKYNLYSDTGKYPYIYLRFGRDFYLDKINGISIDAGLGIGLYNNEGFVWKPALGVCFSHRF
jgi:hypothetical protein